jgi:hypothetical protein
VLDRQIKSFHSVDFREYPRGIDPINGAEITSTGWRRARRDAGS